MSGATGTQEPDASRLVAPGVPGSDSAAAAPAMMTLAQALHWLPGARLIGDGQCAVTRVHTDTRSLRPGDLFLALKGEQHDANAYLEQARSAGASAVICCSGAGLAQLGLPGLEVADTRQALAELAGHWRAQFRLPLVAVTGSNGKTTVTQMLAAILRAWKPDATLATEGNLNNDIGVPLTLLRLRATHQLAVVELGMNQPGEIAALAALTRPTVALVNNAQREHQEFMLTVEAVARENGAVISSLTASGVAVFPHDDRYTGLWRELAAQRPHLSFALGTGANADAVAQADVRCALPRWLDGAWAVQADTPCGPLAFSLHLAGQHNLRNALAAAACALAAGVPRGCISRALQDFRPVKGRSALTSVLLGGHRLTLVDDSYNANPDSVRAAIELLAALDGPRLLVLGDMGEVGAQGPEFHREVGAAARSAGVEWLFTLGPMSEQAGSAFGAGRHFDDIDALNAAVLAQLGQVGSVLVKGSRFMRMERVVAAIVQCAQPERGPNHAA